ncbi:hypothetical protein A6X21_06015 [Planctopirus hydrillae]|uniref:Uncharacterized protein n=1 Tax=Planctopirus hydrillae TaxID=1841610 RepID=A0A1C3EAB8_9PLAN|nr:hypothetical protein A6X21_06015 [Planctopirus hydrillae]
MPVPPLLTMMEEARKRQLGTLNSSADSEVEKAGMRASSNVWGGHFTSGLIAGRSWPLANVRQSAPLRKPL